MTQALWTASQAAIATGGQATGMWSASTVSIDSRTLSPGALYVALKGERVDGHAYVRAALENGAVAAVVSDAVEGVSADKLLVVADTTRALEDLGIAARARSSARVIGVTGSVGKTTTKEMLALMLTEFGRTFATKGNFNNHFGVPLMLANMPLDTEFGVFEMGMNHAGEIRALTAQVKPHVAIISTVEAVHLEFFESVAGIADAKSEIFEGLTIDGVAILNRDNPYFLQCKKAAERCGAARILCVGRHAESDIKLVSVQARDEGVQLHVRFGEMSLEYVIGASGEGAVFSSLIALAVAEALSLNVQSAAKTFAAFQEVDGRGRLQPVVFEGKHMWWMDDSYNASPASMRSAFQKLASVAQRLPEGGRTVAVLGDMLELGAESARFHTELANELCAQHISVVYAAGSLMQHLFEALPVSMQGAYTATVEALESVLREALQAGDVVLFKGSHGSKIYQLVDKLKI